ncbi:hypothetical protein RB597_000642 [Gaeumannomyces tritici]
MSAGSTTCSPEAAATTHLIVVQAQGRKHDPMAFYAPRPAGGGGGSSSSSSSSPRPDSPAAAATVATTIPSALWKLTVPVHITHASLPSSAPFVASVPRFGYLALLLPRLAAYFGRPCSSFHHEDVQLRNLPVGLLVDLYRPQALPWRLVVDEGEGWHIGDTFLNGAKEADFLRNGHAKQIMSMSKDDTTALWNAVQDGDYATFARINNQLLNAPTPLKHVPIRIYIPSSSPSSPATTTPAAAGSFRVMQALVAPRIANKTPQTLGTALRSLLPTLFPSSRDPVLANVILHGAPVPFSAPLEALMREAAYPDGWLCLTVVLL